jgi:nicotinic acid mononucleotide adenylyltransferase
MDDEAIRARLYDLARLLALRAALGRVGGAREPRAELIAGADAARVRRLGLLPGSYNPPTVAHATLAAAGLASGAVEGVLFTLSTHTVDKEVINGAALEDRLLVLELCREDDARLGVLLVNRGLYVEQAQLARTIFPHVRELVFMVGFDKIVQILDPRYYTDRDAALERLFGLATFLVAPRGSEGEAELAALLARPENARFAAAIRRLELPPWLRDVASSRVRASVPRGDLPSEDLPSAVRVFVEETGAYDEPGATVGEIGRYRRRLEVLDALQASGDRSADFRGLVGRAAPESL